MKAPEKPINVCISIPVARSFEPEVTEQLMAMCFHVGRRVPWINVYCRIEARREQFRARNFCVEKGLQENIDWFLFLDDDTVPKPDLIEHLLSHHLADPEKKIIGALYWQRGGSYHPVAMYTTDDGNGTGTIRWVTMGEMEGKLQEVGVIGGGCMLIHRDVFESIGKPYFWNDGQIGTDVQVCTRATENGFKVWWDSGYEVGHFCGPQMISYDTLPSWMLFRQTVYEDIFQDALEYFKLGRDQLLSEINIATKEDQNQFFPKEVNFEGIKRYFATLGDKGVWRLMGYLLSHDWQDDSLVNRLDLSHMVRAGVKRAIDYAPGLGQLTFHLAAAGIHVTAIEVAGCATTSFLKWRLKKHGLDHMVTFEELNEGETDFRGPDGPVDLVICAGVFMHLMDPKAVYGKLLDMLRDGGLFITTMEFPENEDKNPQHIAKMTPPEMMNWLRGKYKVGIVPGLRNVFIKNGKGNMTWLSQSLKLRQPLSKS